MEVSHIQPMEAKKSCGSVRSCHPSTAQLALKHNFSWFHVVFLLWSKLSSKEIFFWPKKITHFPHAQRVPKSLPQPSLPGPSAWMPRLRLKGHPVTTSKNSTAKGQGISLCCSYFLGFSNKTANKKPHEFYLSPNSARMFWCKSLKNGRQNVEI